MPLQNLPSLNDCSKRINLNNSLTPNMCNLLLLEADFLILKEKLVQRLLAPLGATGSPTYVSKCTIINFA